MARLQRRGLIFTLLLLLLSSGSYGLSLLPLPWLDQRADDYFAEAIQQSTIAYAVIRGVNAVVSVIKASEIELAPVGVGVSIAAGQLLDPIDDMTERVSTLLVTAIVSLGVQKVAYELAALVALKGVALCLLLLLIPLWRSGRLTTRFATLLLRGATFLLLLRLLLPLSALASDLVYQGVIAEPLAEAKGRLTLVSDHYQRLRSESGETLGQGGISAITGRVREQFADMERLFQRLIDNMEQITGSLLTLATLYVTLFLLQVVVLPLLSLWFAYRLAGQLFIGGHGAAQLDELLERLARRTAQGSGREGPA